METITASGVVGAVYVAPWDMNGKSGISRTVLVFPAFLLDDNRVGPTKVKVTEEDLATFEQIVEAGPGAAIECTYTLREFGSKVQRELVSLDSITPAGTRSRRQQIAA